jgi:hypothetical protein
MKALPKIFEKVRFGIAPNLRPGVILDTRIDAYAMVDAEVRRFYEENPQANFQLQIRFWKNFWIESTIRDLEVPDKPTKKFAAHCHCADGIMDFSQVSVTVWDEAGRKRGSFRMSEYWHDLFTKSASALDGLTDTQRAFEALAAVITFTLHYYNSRISENVDVISEYGVPPESADMRVYGKIGDTFRYERLSVAMVKKLYVPLAEPALNLDQDGPAYHKRQHEVIGHWRQYRSGRRVFIHAHKRGDPELGVVTKIYT